MRLDPLDASLLQLLLEDARASYSELAQRTGSTVPTVSARVKALEDLGVIRGYRAVIDATLAGGPLAHVSLHAGPRVARQVADALAEEPGVEEVLLLAGGRIAARIRLAPPGRTMQHVHEMVAGLEGVVAYDVHEVLSAAVPAARVGGFDHVDVKCHQCGGPIHDAPIRKAFAGRMSVFCCRQCLAAFAARVEKAAQGARASRTIR